jgi:hypothetical protein
LQTNMEETAPIEGDAQTDDLDSVEDTLQETYVLSHLPAASCIVLLFSGGRGLALHAAVSFWQVHRFRWNRA